MCTEEKLHLILDHCETLYKRLLGFMLMVTRGFLQ